MLLSPPYVVFILPYNSESKETDCSIVASQMYFFFFLGNPSSYEMQAIYGLSLWVQVKLDVLGYWLPPPVMQIAA